MNLPQQRESASRCNVNTYHQLMKPQYELKLKSICHHHKRDHSSFDLYCRCVYIGVGLHHLATFINVCKGDTPDTTAGAEPTRGSTNQKAFLLFQKAVRSLLVWQLNWQGSFQGNQSGNDCLWPVCEENKKLDDDAWFKKSPHWGREVGLNM